MESADIITDPAGLRFMRDRRLSNCAIPNSVYSEYSDNAEKSRGSIPATIDASRKSISRIWSEAFVSRLIVASLFGESYIHLMHPRNSLMQGPE